MIRILTVLEEMKETQRVQNGMLQALLLQNKQKRDPSQLPQDAKFPIKDVATFKVVEQQLQNEDFAKALVRVIVPTKPI